MYSTYASVIRTYFDALHIHHSMLVASFLNIICMK